MNKDTLRLCKAIRKQREAIGMTQSQLGRLIGIHRVTVGRIEAGECDVRLETLFRLLKEIKLTIIFTKKD